MTEQSIWDMLEDRAPEGCGGVQDLYGWSLNYDPGKGPFTLFCDLIGWTEDQYGEDERLYHGRPYLGHVEADKLARALSEWADHPGRVMVYVTELLAAEGSEH